MPSALFAYVGIFAVAVFLLVALSTLTVYLRPSKLPRYLHTKNSQPAWALVTGASAGIGKAFAHSLAEAGFNGVIHGRNPSKLAVVLGELDLNLNALFPTLLTRALTPVLVANGPALIIFVGSVADLELPLVAPYGSSRSFLRTLADSMALEMKMTGRDIEVLHLRVGPVTGVATIWRRPSWLQPHATTLAQTVLDRVGCGRAVAVPYLPHTLLSVVTSLMPRWARDVSFSQSMAELARQGPNGEHESNAEDEIRKAKF